jgi:2-polyprenyl-3-methyl-5-hydroxy-6-metoxy-1,4-benzoquinol methylase
MNRVEAIVGPANGRILHDVGCGTGSLIFEARRRGWRVQGSDIVPGVKQRHRKNGIRCLIGTLSDLSIPDEFCDVVTSFCVLPHHLTGTPSQSPGVERAAGVSAAMLQSRKGHPF